MLSRVIVSVVSLDGQVEGNPVPINTILPPFNDPLIAFETMVVFNTTANTLVSPTGSSLTLTLYDPDGTLGILKLALVALTELTPTIVFYPLILFYKTILTFVDGIMFRLLPVNNTVPVPLKADVTEIAVRFGEDERGEYVNVQEEEDGQVESWISRFVTVMGWVRDSQVGDAGGVLHWISDDDTDYTKQNVLT